MKLFIVESPKKCSSLKKILGYDYEVIASVGHIREIPSNGMNIDIQNGFIPSFVVSNSRKDVVFNIVSLASEAEEIILATDLDREGEAIAYHIYDILPTEDKKKCKRVRFNAITKKAVLDALKNKEDLNMNLVNSQKARQVLDRLIGYTISPLLWKKVAKKTSAGRVQSVALKIVSDREKEIQEFKPTGFWYIDVKLSGKSKESFEARVQTEDKDNRYSDKDLVEKDANSLLTATYTVDKIERREKSVNPHPPFDTSSLQTSASSIFNWSIKKTAQVAQSLYEQGKCSYIRTDSFNIDPEFIAEARCLIKEKGGSKYLPSTPNVYEKKAKSSAQEAHECIRPTDCSDLGNDLQEDEKKLYKLIRDRFISCQMTPMIMDTVVYYIKTDTGHTLIARGQNIKFDGWTRMYKYSTSKEITLPDVIDKEVLKFEKLKKEDRSTKPPPRYSEGALVKKMEEDGVGRPSTYPAILDNILNREYIKKMNKKGILEATELGLKVSDYLTEHFNDFIMDVGYTAQLESNLDIIEDGKKTYFDVVSETYNIMNEHISKACSDDVQVKGSTVCTECKIGEIQERVGKFGSFYSCNRYPECSIVYVLDKEGVFHKKGETIEYSGKTYECMQCKKNGRKGTLTKRKNKNKDSYFYGCSNYPTCTHVESDSIEGFDF